MPGRATDQTCVHTFDSLEDTWDGLLGECPADTVFLTPYWQRLWWERFGGEGLLLVSLCQDGETLGIAPLQRLDSTVTFLGDTDLFDYHDFVVREGREGPFYAALGEWLEREPWERLLLTSVPEGSACLERLPGLARLRGWGCAVEEEDVAPGLPLPPDWEGYLSGLGKKDRHELRRKLRRLEGAGDAVFRTYESVQDVGEHMEGFLRLMRQSREEKHRFLTPEREGFFRAMGGELASRGVAQLWFLEVGGREVATALCFDYGGRRLLYNSGFDPEFSHLSVGLLLKAACLRDAIGRGLGYFDFLRGDEAYKYDLGGADRRVYRIAVTR